MDLDCTTVGASEFRVSWEVSNPHPSEPKFTSITMITPVLIECAIQQYVPPPESWLSRLSHLPLDLLGFTLGGSTSVCISRAWSLVTPTLQRFCYS